MRSVDGKRRDGGRKTKSEGMKGAGAENVKRVHKYRGPQHITTVTGPLILTPAVLVTMDTSRLGPSLRPSTHTSPSSGLLLRHLTRAPEKAVIIRLSARPSLPWRQRLHSVFSLPDISRWHMLTPDSILSPLTLKLLIHVCYVCLQCCKLHLQHFKAPLDVSSLNKFAVWKNGWCQKRTLLLLKR